MPDNQTISQGLPGPRGSVRKAIKNGTLPINAGIIQAEPICSTLKDYLNLDEILLEQCKVQSDSETHIALKGRTGSLLNLSSLEVDIVFFISDSESEGQKLACIIKAALPAKWNIKNTYPELPGYQDCSAELFWEGDQKSFLTKLSIQKPEFVFSSLPISSSDNIPGEVLELLPKDNGNPVDIKKGINYFGVMGLDGPLAQVGDILKAAAPLSFHGHIELDKDNPRLLINTELPFEFEIGEAKLELLDMTVYSSLSESAIEYDSGVSLRGGINLGEITLSITADLAIGGDIITFESLFDNLKLPGLDALAQLTGSKELSSLLPPSLSQFESFYLTRMELYFSPSTLKIDTAGFEIRSTDVWHIIPGTDYLNVNEVLFSLNVQFPFTSYTDISLSVYAQADIGASEEPILIDISGAIDLDLGGDTISPEIQIQGGLAPDSRIRLTSILGYFSLPDIPNMPSLDIVDLDLAVNTGERSFDMNVRVENEWALQILPSFSVSLEELVLNISYTHADDGGTFSALMECVADIAGIDCYFSAEHTTDGNWSFTGRTAYGSAISVNELIDAFLQNVTLPPQLPEVFFSDLEFSFSLPGNSARFSSRSGVSVPITLGSDSLESSLLIDLMLEEGKPSGRLHGAIGYRELELALDIELGETTSLVASATNLNLSEVVRKLLAIDLPSEIPDVLIENLSISISGERDISIRGLVRTDYSAAEKDSHALTIGGEVLPLASLEFEYSMTRTGAACSIKVEGENIALTDDVRFENFSFAFGYDSGDWKLAGDVRSRIFDREFSLTAAYAVKGKKKIFALAYADTSSTALLDIPNIISLDIDELKLIVEKDEGESASWEFDTVGGLRIADGVLDIRGALSLYSKKDGAKGIAFRPETAHFELPLLVGGHLDLDFGDITIERESDADGGGWALDSSVTVSCDAFHKALPTPVQKEFPQSITTSFRADKNAVTLSLDRILNPVDITLPDIEIDSHNKIPLGMCRLDASDLSIQIGKEASISAKFGIGLPAALNNIFGLKKDGKTPKVKLFKTFDPKDEENTVVRARLSVGTDGLKAVLETSPIEAISLEEKDGKVWWNCDMGDFGAVSFQVPEFSYETKNGAFKASGGFEVTKTLALPLTPVKAGLTNMGLKPVADIIPESLSISDLTLLDDNNNFREKEFCDFLNSVLPGDKLPPEIAKPISIIGNFIDRLPDNFREYLNIKAPDSFSFDIAVSPEGSVRFDVSADENNPVKLLYPTPNLGLEGIQLKGLSFGLAFGGSVAIVKADMRIDEFDLPTLTAALLLPEGHDLPLPDPHRFSRRLIIDDLLMLVVLCTEIPIPIPLFYDELGVEYLGLEGVTTQAHIRFPMPEIGLIEIVKVLSNFVGFVTKPEVMMDPDALTTEQQLSFTIGDTYMQLPEYLGGAVLGNKGHDFSIKTYSILANLMNTIKKHSIIDLIQMTPLHYRVGTEKVVFGPFEFGIKWLLTTPDEFRRLAVEELDYTADQQESFLQVLPAVRPDRTVDKKGMPVLTEVETTDEEGLVAFLDGQVTLGEWANFEATFGLMATGSMGFHTGFRIAGSIINLVDMELAGRVSINKPDSDVAFRLEGHSHLWILDHRIFEGDIQIIDKEFWLKGDLDLFPEGSPLQVKGKLEGSLSNDKLLLAGEVKTTLFDLKLAGAKGFISNDGVVVQANMFGVTTTLAAKKENNELALYGQTRLHLWGLHASANISISKYDGIAIYAEIDPIDIGAFELTGIDRQPRATAHIHTRGNVIKKLDIAGCVKLLGFRAKVDITASSAGFRFDTEARIFNKFIAAIKVSGSVPDGLYIKASMKNDLFTLLRDEAINVIKATASNVDKGLEEAQKAMDAARVEVLKLNKEILRQREIIKKERETAKANLDKAVRDLSNAQSEVNKILRTINYNEGLIKNLQKGKWVWILLVKVWVYDDPLALVKMAGLRTAITVEWMAYGTSQATLEVAKTAVKVAEGFVVTTPIDLDPRVSGPKALRDAAILNLNIAKEFLKNLKTSVDITANVAEAIARGVGDVLNIHSASFEAELKSIVGSSVKMSLDLTFIGKRQKTSLSINFDNPIESARSLAQSLMLPKA